MELTAAAVSAPPGLDMQPLTAAHAAQASANGRDILQQALSDELLALLLDPQLDDFEEVGGCVCCWVVC